MELRRRLAASPETLQDFYLAAELRYEEGLELLIAGRLSAGIYLLGYTAEMLLKSACFHMDGARLFDRVEPYFAPARHWQRLYFPIVPMESYHSLWFWCLLLRKKRRHVGHPLPSTFDQEFVRRVRHLYGTWWIEMRYRPDRAVLSEAQRFYDHVTWIRDHHTDLWR